MMKKYKQSDNENYNQDITETIKIYEEAIGHYASRTHALIANHGNIGTLEVLMDNVEIQKGFKTFRDKKMLDKTFEAILIKYKKEIEFNKNSVEIAEFRLKNPNWIKGL
jgi:hypothetical protein